MSEDTGETVPSAGACMRSLAHVLNKTDGVLDQELRKHLMGVMEFVNAAEKAGYSGRNNQG